MVDGLVLINCNSQNAGWVEWVYNKINIKSLKKVGSNQNVQPLPETVVDYLIWYHLGRPDGEGRGLEATTVASIHK